MRREGRAFIRERGIVSLNHNPIIHGALWLIFFPELFMLWSIPRRCGERISHGLEHPLREEWLESANVKV